MNTAKQRSRKKKRNHYWAFSASASLRSMAKGGWVPLDGFKMRSKSWRSAYKISPSPIPAIQKGVVTIPRVACSRGRTTGSFVLFLLPGYRLPNKQRHSCATRSYLSTCQPTAVSDFASTEEVRSRWQDAFRGCKRVGSFVRDILQYPARSELEHHLLGSRCAR
jgi:hypothetical protein